MANVAVNDGTYAPYGMALDTQNIFQKWRIKSKFSPFLRVEATKITIEAATSR